MSTETQYTPELIERFYTKVSKIPTESGCLEWMAFHNTDGYGAFGVGPHKVKRAHRVAWEIANGPIPAGMVIRHMCHNPLCCRIEHLRLGTQDDNIRDMMSSGRWMNAPNTNTPYIRPDGPTVAERFWQKVDKRGPNECWEWTASLNNQGYGRLSIGGKNSLAHRVAWELTHGPIPAGLVIAHRCDNRRCVNIEHLFLGTTSDNVQDMLSKGRGGVPPIQRGEQAHAAKLTESQVLEIRSEKYSGWEQRDIAECYGVSQHCIWSILNRKTWAHLGGGGNVRTSNAKLTEADVLAIRGGHFVGWTQTAIAEHFGVSDGLISGVLHRRAWTHLDSSQDAPDPRRRERGRIHEGETHYAAKLTEAQVLDIRSDRLAGWTQKEIADHFGITQHSVWCILHRKTWKHI